MRSRLRVIDGDLYSLSGATSDDTLIIATQTPAAVQCISWNPHEVNATQTAVQSKLGILVDPSGTGSITGHGGRERDLRSIVLEKVTTAIYDRAMNISVWLSDAGRAYYVQNTGSSSSSLKERRRSRASIGVRIGFPDNNHYWKLTKFC